MAWCDVSCPLGCSVAVLLTGIIIALCLSKSRYRKYTVLAVLASLFWSICCLYFPLINNLLFDEAKPEPNFIRDMFLTFYHSFKVFTSDANFEEVFIWLKPLEPVWLGSFYKGWFIFLCIMAILSTAAGIIRIFFKDLWAIIRFLWCKTKLVVNALSNREELENPCNAENAGKAKNKKLYGIYFFSELNSKSLALAQSIKEKRECGAFVFFDVYAKYEENSAEIRSKADELGAIVFSKDILAFKSNLEKKYKSYVRGRVEIFIIGENESENISQAIALTGRYKHRYNTQIFVWARNPESAVILDSIDKIDSNAENKGISAIDNPYSFKVRRIDDVERYAWQVLEEVNLFKDRQGKRRDLISILIIGMGETGRELLKTASWMYQMEGVRLKINAVDITDKTAKILSAECPELLEKNDCREFGEANYSIRFFDNVDIFEDDPADENSFRKLLSGDNVSKDNLAKRIRETTDVLIALGDDDLNIRGAMIIRSLFECAKYKGFCTDDPRIITQVYDPIKSQNITSDNEAGSLRTYQEDSVLGITFAGSFNDRYRYDSINRQIEEEEAIKYHINWCYDTKDEKERKEKIEKEKEKYNQFEYFRRSSIAKGIHKKLMKDNFCEEVTCMPDKETKGCLCKKCEKGRRVEHMRWNAYMRSQGYSLPPESYKGTNINDAIAKLHSKLVPFDELAESEQLKD